MREFWAGKRVFLTGHTGFKGSWLSLWLRELGANVVGYALPPPRRSLFVDADVASGMSSLTGDVRDAGSLASALRAARPDVVFHLAAQSLVRASYRDPGETYTTNVIGTLNLLEAVRGCDDVRAVVVVTTDKCYENRDWPWGYREIDALGGHDPYSSSKACAELVTASHRRSFFCGEVGGRHPAAIATARAGNVIGGGDWATDRLLPDVVRAIEASVPVRVRSPGAVRPWQHVLDPLAGYLALAQRLHDEGEAYAEAWNFGPDAEDARSVADVLRLLAEHWGPELRWETEDRPQAHEARLLSLDCAKAKSRLGWAPRWRLHDALASTAEWYRAALSGSELRDLTLRQIARHATVAP